MNRVDNFHKAARRNRLLFKDVKKKEATFSAEHDIRLPTDKDKTLICASLVLPSGDIIIADNNNKNLKLYDNEFRIISVLQLNQFPTDMCLSNISLDEIYVTDIDTIHVISVDEGLNVIGPVRLDGQKWGITTWKNGLAVGITLQFKDTPVQARENLGVIRMVDKNLIRLLNFEGFVVRTLTNDTLSNFSIVCPFHMSSVYGGKRIVVSDSGTNKVTCLDVDGGIVFVYNDRELKVPTSLATDGHGSIYIIGQYTGTVHQITENGLKLGIILSDRDGLRWPGGIAFDNWNNRLILQANGFEDKIQSFSLKN